MRKAVRIEPAFANGHFADDGDDAVHAGAQRKDRIAAALALIAASTIVVNALYLQKGPHPAPILNNKPAIISTKVSRPVVESKPAVDTKPVAAPAPQVVAVVLPRPRPADLGVGSVPVNPVVRAEPVAVQRTVREEPVVTIPVPRPPDPIADIITPSKRVMAVQRTLTEFGYGQLRPTGNFDRDTQEAIAQFERARKLPVTRQITPVLIRELSAMAGRPIE